MQPLLLSTANILKCQQMVSVYPGDHWSLLCCPRN